MRSLSRSTPFRSSPALFLLAAALFTRLAAADVLTVGPIYVSGSGIYWPHDPNQDGGGPGISFGASGSNGVDSVSFGGDVDTGGILPAFQNPATAVGYTFGFGSGPEACFNGPGTGVPACSADIDGIRGIPAFGIGEDFGFVDVYEQEGFPPNIISVGPLLAEATIITHCVVTSVDYVGGPIEFAMVTPEPSTGLLALIGLFGIVAFRTKSRISRW